MVKFRPLFKEIKRLPEVVGVSALDILNLPDEIGRLIRILSNERTMALSEIADHFQISQKRTQRLMSVLVEKGYMQKIDPQSPETEPQYQVKYARMRKKHIPLDL